MTSSKSTASRQTTLKRAVALSGRGVHTDAPARLSISPAEAGTGVVFLLGEAERPVAALWRNVCATHLRTKISRDGAAVSTIEHLMAALYGLGVDNALIDLDGPEVPAMDGSAGAFVTAIREAGLARLSAPRRIIKVREAVRVSDGAAWAELAPGSRFGLDLDVEIAFSGALGRQRVAFTLTPEVFARELAPARSFGFVHDAERLWREGLALGANLDNCVVLDGDQVLNPRGLRFSDEYARHKMLDVIGDLALAGAPIHGAFRSYRGGHKLNLALVEKFMATASAYEIAGGADARARSAPAINKRGAP